MRNFDVDVAILGAGTAGLVAYREARKQKKEVRLIDGGTLGTTCARVGCMPSKLLIAAANAYHDANAVGAFGIEAGTPKVDGRAVMARVKSERDKFTGSVTESMDAFPEGDFIPQYAKFLNDNLLELSSGEKLSARTVVIATGSHPVIPESLEPAGDRIIVNDDIFYWDELPESIAVFGLGVIGLELAQALHRLGVEVHIFARSKKVGLLTDPAVQEFATTTFASELNIHWHSDPVVSRSGDSVSVSWQHGDQKHEQSFDYALAATGRRPNVASLDLHNTSLKIGPKGIPEFDTLSLQAGSSSIFIAGDVGGVRAVLHESADDGRVAGQNAARHPDILRHVRRTALGIVFSSPQIAVVGASHAKLIECGADFETGEYSFKGQGRAKVQNRDHGLIRLYGEKDTGILLGGEMIGPDAEHLAHLLAWSIGTGQSVTDILGLTVYHPVVEEGLRSALRSLNFALGFGPNPPLRSLDCGPGS